MPAEIPFLNMEAVNYALSQRLVRLQVPFDVIRVSEFVKYADRAHLLGGAAEHAPVGRVDRDVAIFDFGDGDPDLGAFKDGAEFLLAFPHAAFKRMALGNIQKGANPTASPSLPYTH